MTADEERQRFADEVSRIVASQITTGDLANLARWMADGGWHTTDEIADAVEKPWKWWDEIQALRSGDEPEGES